MKKTFIAASVMGLMAASTTFAAPGSETVNVTFVGEVKDLTCTVQVGGPNNVVNLGMLDAVPGATGTIVPVMFRFSGCDKDAKLSSIQLTGAQNGSHADEDITTGLLGTDRHDVMIQLMTKVDGTFENKPVSFEDQQQNPMDLAAGGAVTPYYAQLQADDVNAPKAGPVNSNAVFTVVYK